MTAFLAFCSPSSWHDRFLTLAEETDLHEVSSLFSETSSGSDYSWVWELESLPLLSFLLANDLLLLVMAMTVG
jgi:hypothetical protein